MNRRSLFWKVYPYYFVVILVSILLIAIYSLHVMRKLYIDQVTDSLEARARLIERVISRHIAQGEIMQIQSECERLSELSGSRITIIDASGVVLGDSEKNPQAMENHRMRPEIVEALDKEVGVSIRFSNTLQANLIYVAIPALKSNEVVAVVRCAVPFLAVESVFASFQKNIALSGAVILMIAALVSMVLLRRLTVPLAQMREASVRFAEGNLTTRLPVSRIHEFEELSKSMNVMAQQLDTRIKTIARQRNEREAILASMAEGLLAIDENEEIVLLNRVAAEMLGVDMHDSYGKHFYEVLRIPAVFEFIEESLRSNKTIETQIGPSGVSGRFLQAKASALQDSAGDKRGLVIVFNDVTRMKRLEEIRREFVANVSHELKTPITAITGSVETLLDGGIETPGEGNRFLEIIARHSERLNLLIDDLLSLAQIEADSEKAGADLSRGRLVEVIHSAVTSCEEKSRRHNVSINVSCEEGLEVMMNRVRLEQAVINLIDNAIKHSEQGSVVYVEAVPTGNEIVVSVKDNGAGIAEKHLPRLFERFYRVDKARSRDEGGTGLGLAIVKHVAVAHRGNVSVESSPGKGSSFSIHLPMIQ